MYETAQEIFDMLCEPFPPQMVEWRVGPSNKKSWQEGQPRRGQPLCYVDARTVMDRLDSICGPDGWQCNYSSGMQGSIICNIGLRMPSGEWIWKADGAGETDMEADKGALSDAFKRAAVRWGLGRYLYEIKHPWIDLNERWAIDDTSRRKLDNFYDEEAPKAMWGIRAGAYPYRALYRAIEQFCTSAADAAAFREKNGGIIAQFPVAMRKHFNDKLDKIGAPTAEAAE